MSTAANFKFSNVKVLKSDNELEAFKFIVRAQLVPSKYKQDVYYAEDEIYGKCFVKGPIVNEKTVEDIELFNKWEKENGIASGDFYFTYLYPTRWPEGTPLGYRNYIDRSKKYLFMVSKALLDNEDVKIRKHSSKVWPITEILESDRSWDPVKMWQSVDKQAKCDYIIAILYKAMIGVKDLADRNFCYFKGNVYAIDNDEANREFFNPIEALTLAKRKLFLGYFLDHFDVFYVIVNSWSPLKNYNKPLLDFMEDISMKRKNNFNFNTYFEKQTTKYDLTEDANKRKKTRAVQKYNALTNDDDNDVVAKHGPWIGYRGTISSHNHKNEALISGIHKYIRRGESDKLCYVFSQLLSYLQTDQCTERKAKLTFFANRVVISVLEDASTSPHLLPMAIQCYNYIKSFNFLLGDSAKTSEPNPDYFVKLAYYVARSKRCRLPSGMSTLSRAFENMPEKIMSKYENLWFEHIMNARKCCFENEQMNILKTETYFSDCLTKKNIGALVVYKSLYDKKSTLVVGVNFLKQVSSLLGVPSKMMEDSFQSVKGKKEEFMAGADILFWYIIGYDPHDNNSNPNEVLRLKKVFNSTEHMVLDKYVTEDKHVKPQQYGLEEFIKEGSVVTNHSLIPEALAVRKLYEDTRLINYDQ